MGSLIDSSVFIAAERGDDRLKVALSLLNPTEGDHLISVVTIFELLHGVHRASPAKRAYREAFVENAIQTFPTLVFDEAAARVFASVDAALSAAGNKLPVEDLMIAATALANGHDVITRDLRSFGIGVHRRYPVFDVIGVALLCQEHLPVQGELLFG